MKYIITSCFILVIGLGFIISASPVSAADIPVYKSLVELPLPKGVAIEGEGGYTTQDFIRILYALSISAAALLAVVKIIFGGVKYMLSDIVTDKAGAKKDIQGALLGLLIVLGAFLILNTINPQLTSLSLIVNAPEFDFEKAKVEKNPLGTRYGDKLTECGTSMTDSEALKFASACTDPNTGGAVTTEYTIGATCKTYTCVIKSDTERNDSVLQAALDAAVARGDFIKVMSVLKPREDLAVETWKDDFIEECEMSENVETGHEVVEVQWGINGNFSYVCVVPNEETS